MLIKCQTYLKQTPCTQLGPFVQDLRKPTPSPLETHVIKYASLHENKKVLSPFYLKKYFSWKMNVRHPAGCLTFIFCQKYFYDKMDFRLFYFHATM